MMKRQKISLKNRGFTVVELLVALAVFSVVLLVVTVGIMQVSRLYYEGVTEASTQATARNIIDNISQALQFDGGTPTSTPPVIVPGTSYAFCVNNQQYSYRPGYQLVDNAPGAHQTSHALVVQTLSGCAAAPAQNLSAGGVTGRELLSPNMRLAELTVTKLSTPSTINMYKVHVRVVYGDFDLLQSPSGSVYADAAPDAVCKGVTGRQFCSVADLTTIVTSRVE